MDRTGAVVILEVYGREGLLKEPGSRAYHLQQKIDTDMYGSDGMLVYESTTHEAGERIPGAPQFSRSPRGGRSYCGWEVVPFNADEAVVALMARHILQGAMSCFYGQHYMGSLDAYLIAAGFLLFGQQVWVIRLVQALLYLGTWLRPSGWAGSFRELENRSAGSRLLAIPTVNLTVYTTATLGGYGETLLIGNLVLWLGLEIAKRFDWRWMLLGVCRVGGCGRWI